MLTLIRAHALLHRASRDLTEAGAIIATMEDYAVVRKLVDDLFSEGIEATVSATVRETVGAVAALNKNEVWLGELAAAIAGMPIAPVNPLDRIGDALATLEHTPAPQPTSHARRRARP